MKVWLKMHKLFIIIISTVSVVNSLGSSRQLGIFGIVRFPNDGCEGGGQRTGTCMTRTQCLFKGGLVVGLCAQAFGVCCEITRTCNEEIRDNGTFFVNPDYPRLVTTPQNCRLTVRKRTPNICQLRLDFDQFSIRGPSLDNGKCNTDYFLVSGQDTNSVVPSICGDNGGQHVYVNVASTGGPVSLFMTTSGNGGGYVLTRQWKIRVTQIPCDSSSKAPEGCLQYFTGASDNIRSFNYGNDKVNQTGYPSGLDYAVCIRKEHGLCSASFRAEGKYAISGQEADQPSSGSACDNKDYLLIGEQRYCGGTGFDDKADPPTTSGTGPILFTFVSQSQRALGTQPSIGFNLKYSQNRCSSFNYIK